MNTRTLKSAGRPTAVIRQVKNALDHRTATAIKCGTCTACCRTYDVDVHPWDSDEGLDVVDVDGRRLLRKTDDGACVHLGPTGCTVYDRRPSACKTYDCRPMALGAVVPSRAHAGGVSPVLKPIRAWTFDLCDGNEVVTAFAFRRVAQRLVADGVDVDSAAIAALGLYPAVMADSRRVLAAMDATQRRILLRSLAAPGATAEALKAEAA